ncbi:hypothetical protein [uncultured Gimesia sp.]|uniref:hypothetical protein n=1 Tax=uncultured Gimesia sp. TaxID=1678688 RepID=UPI0030DCEFCB|tara:strand:- start:17812 stop:18558 length:747 start_codon:yes stop_codon:yes gene_type:complete
MHEYSMLSDDYFTNLNLCTEMTLPSSRDTVLNFFERVQKSFPTMRNFYNRGESGFILEEDKEEVGQQRWMSLESQRVCSGYSNPKDPDDCLSQHQLMLELVPYMLSVSPLDCEALDYIVGFDFAYRGNHDALVAEALGANQAIDSLLQIPNSQALNYEPSITLSLDDSCRCQARLHIETRTNAYQVRRDDYPDEQISVFFTLRQYGSLSADTKLEDTLLDLKTKSDQLMQEYVIEQVLRPLAQAISTK